MLCATQVPLTAGNHIPNCLGLHLKLLHDLSFYLLPILVLAHVPPHLSHLPVFAGFDFVAMSSYDQLNYAFYKTHALIGIPPMSNQARSSLLLGFVSLLPDSASEPCLVTLEK